MRITKKESGIVSQPYDYAKKISNYPHSGQIISELYFNKFYFIFLNFISINLKKKELGNKTIAGKKTKEVRKQIQHMSEN